MDQNLSGSRPHFRPQKRTINPYRVIILLALIMGGIWILMSIDRGEVQPLFQPTPTPTRTANSYVMEGEAQFFAGALGGAIEAYLQRPQFELYDIENDPDEIINLAYEHKYWEIVEDLKEQLKKFMADTDDPWKLKWNYD